MGELLAKATIAVPGAWQEALPAGTALLRWNRGFNCPTGLENHRIALVIDHCNRPVRVALNGRWLIEQPHEDFPLRFEIAAFLEPHNELVLETAGTELALVSLEITGSAG